MAEHITHGTPVPGPANRGRDRPRPPRRVRRRRGDRNRGERQVPPGRHHGRARSGRICADGLVDRCVWRFRRGAGSALDDRGRVARIPAGPGHRRARAANARHRALPRRAGGHRGVGRPALTRGPDRAVDARRQPDQMAPGPRDLVLRAVRADASPAGLPPHRRSLPVFVELLLRGRRTPAPSGRAGTVEPAGGRRGDRLPRHRGRGGRGPARSVVAAERPGPGRARLASRAAAPGVAAHGHQACARHQPSAPRLPAYPPPGGRRSRPARLGRLPGWTDRGRRRRPEPASVSTTSSRATRSSCDPSSWPTGW